MACLVSPAAYANGPQVGGTDANLGAIPGNQFSTTTRLNGEVLFSIRDTLGENDPGEGALFGASDRLRLGFDSSFTGEDSLRARLTGSVGASENVQESLYNSDSSMYYFLGGDIGASVSNGPLDVVVGIGGGLTYYDEDLDWREEDENWVPDVYGSIGARYTFTESVVAKLFARGYYGGQASVSREFIKDGVTSSNYFFWDLDLGVDARFDNAPLGDRGLEFSANFAWGGLEEDGDGPASNQLDNYDIEFRGEGRYIVDESTTVFVAGSYGHREFGEYHPMGMSVYDLNSDSFRVGGGGRVQWGDNFSAGAEAGVEQREYDDLPAAGDDSRTEFYINGDIQWKPVDPLSLGVYADYGIQNFNINEGPVGAFVDPLGLRGGLRAQYQWNTTTSLTADWNLTRAHGSEVVDPMYDGYDFLRWACGLSLNHMLNDRVELFLDGEVILLDNDVDDETYFRGGVGARVGF